MKAIITMGYGKYMLEADEDEFGTVMGILGNLVPVEQTESGIDVTFTPTHKDMPVELVVVSDDRIVGGE